jgi:hypothetical protein
LLSVPIEIRPHVGAAMTAGLANELRLDIGQPGIIGPAIATDRNRVTATINSAVHEQPTHAHVAHLGKDDLGGPINA